MFPLGGEGLACNIDGKQSSETCLGNLIKVIKVGGMLVSYISRESNAVMTSYNWGNVNHNSDGGFGKTIKFYSGSQY